MPTKLSQPIFPGPQVDRLTAQWELFNLFLGQVQDYAFYLLDPQGRVLTWNPGAERIKGYRESEILGRHFSIFYPPGERDKADDALRIATETGHFEAEDWRCRKDGSLLWGSVVLTALWNESGELRGFAKMTRDLTERKQAEERYRLAERKYHLLMAGMNEYAIFLMDRDGVIFDWSSAAERLLGYSQNEIIGKHLSTFFPSEERGPDGIPATVLRQATRCGRTIEESWHVRSDGSRFWGSGITSAMHDDEGKLQGFAKVLLDCTERKRVEDSLREADRRKDEFLAMLAHELRNPLVPIQSGMDLLRLESKDSEVLQIMSEQLSHVVRLVDDLLDVSRILRGKAELRRVPVELSEIVRRAVEAVRPMTEAEGQEFSVSLPARPVWLDADSVRMAQVLTNLLANASKYTEPGGRIGLSAEVCDGNVAIQVTDTGIGIDADILPYVFELFTQSSRALDRSQGGLGIGLTIVKNLVEMHGGTVAAHSAGRGAGSQFTVGLPVIAPPAPVPRSKEPERPSGHSLRILVVDDNVPAATLLNRLLAKLGSYEIHCVHDGMTAIEAIHQHRPDLVLLDIGLPRMDGYEVARQIRQQSKFDDVLLVALTGYGTIDDRRRSSEAGFDEHITKPPSIDILKNLLMHIKLKDRPR